MKKVILGLLAVALTTATFAAETYSVEAAARYNTFKKEEDNLKTTSSIAQGTYYFKPITIDSAQPFFEQEFLQRSSGITLKGTVFKAEDNNFAKTTAYPVNASGKFYLDKFVAGLSYTYQAKKNFGYKDTTTNIHQEVSGNGSQLSLGYFVTQNTSLSYVHGQSVTKRTDISTDGTRDPLSNYNWKLNGIASHTVYNLTGSQWLVADLGYYQIKQEMDPPSEKNREYSVSLSYYPFPKLYLQGGYIRNTGENQADKGRTASLGLGYLITQRLGVLLSSYKFTGSVPSEQSNTTVNEVVVGYRF